MATHDHDAHNAHDDANDAPGGHHDQPGPDNDAPLVRPDGSPEPPHRPLPLGVGITGTIVFLLIIAGLIVYVNLTRSAPTPEATQHEIIDPAVRLAAQFFVH